MDASAFDDPNGRPVTAVTAAEMRAVDRVAVEAIGLDLCRMMEHAGRGLAEAVLDVRSSDGSDGHIAVLAGNGGNGGGGLACARHLANRDLPVRVVLDRDPASIDGVTAEQLRILEAMDVSIGSPDRDTDTDTALDGFVVDALIGYGLTGAPRGAAAGLIEAVDSAAETIVSLDVPSGTNATTGVAVEPDRTVARAAEDWALRGRWRPPPRRPLDSRDSVRPARHRVRRPLRRRVRRFAVADERRVPCFASG